MLCTLRSRLRHEVSPGKGKPRPRFFIFLYRNGNLRSTPIFFEVVRRGVQIDRLISYLDFFNTLVRMGGGGNDNLRVENTISIVRNINPPNSSFIHED